MHNAWHNRAILHYVPFHTVVTLTRRRDRGYVTARQTWRQAASNASAYLSQNGTPFYQIQRAVDVAGISDIGLIRNRSCHRCRHVDTKNFTRKLNLYFSWGIPVIAHKVRCAIYPRIFLIIYNIHFQKSDFRAHSQLKFYLVSLNQ